jgi:drug/metabolite transporter (DMT)-like permease
MTPAAIAARDRTRILVAFAAVYFVWGSTYLFIRFAIETIPPFLLGGVRFLLSGAILYVIARRRGAPRPTTSDLRMAAITGFLMLGMGNGGVLWAEQTVPSGVAALIVSTVPVWIVLIDWLRPNGVRPRLPVFAGLALGLAGMIILIGPRAVIGHGNVDVTGALVLLVGSVGWAVGTLLSRRSARTGSPVVISALQMLAASIALTVAAVVSGEPSSFAWSQVSRWSLVSLAYLVFGGSIIGYTAYVYLLGRVSAAKAATYAYVNPVIAVLLGWAFAHEPIGARTIIAAAVILAGVAIITSMQSTSGEATGEHPVPTESDRQRSAA